MSGWSPASVLRWLFDSEQGVSGRLLPRWIFLRALGLIYYSAFFSLVFQIRGLIGPHGILPAGEYLQALAERFAPAGFEFVAAGNAGDLFRLLSLVRERGTGFFRLSVRWNAAGSGVYCPVFRAGGIPTRVG